jgi:molybdate transport system ATP-binding protein
MSGLNVHAELSLGSLQLRVSIEVAPGEVVALLGPNGAGKSTLVRLIAGLASLDRGSIRLDDVTFDEPSADLFVPPEARSIGVVFQQYRLIPTLTIRENVAFGLRARGARRVDARRAADSWLERVGLGGSGDLLPSQISGGQAQRVALARALAIEPNALLLDEPLAALDARTRSQVRSDLRNYLDAFTGPAIIVTHDPVDAHALADRIVVIEAGAIMQAGALADIAAHPRSAYVADLVGVNLVNGVVTAGVLTADGGGRLVVTGDHAGAARAVIRPQAIALHAQQPHGSPRNCWQSVVADVDTYADRVRVRLSAPLPVVAEITPGALAELDLRSGAPVWVSVKATEIAVFPA